MDRIQDLLVRVTLDNGETGFGEAPPTAVITGETIPSMQAAIRDYLAPSVLGLDPSDREECFARLEKAMAKNTSAKAALDIAIHDALSRALGQRPGNHGRRHPGRRRPRLPHPEGEGRQGRRNGRGAGPPRAGSRRPRCRAAD